MSAEARLFLSLFLDTLLVRMASRANTPCSHGLNHGTQGPKLALRRTLCHALKHDARGGAKKYYAFHSI